MAKEVKTGTKTSGKREIKSSSKKVASKRHLSRNGIRSHRMEKQYSGAGVVTLEPVMLMNAQKSERQMTAIEKMEAARSGISKTELEQLKEHSQLDYDQLAQLLDVSRATLINKKGNDRFPLTLSERILSLADIYSSGYEVFGDAGQFNAWIFQTNKALGGKPPFELLDNQYGREEVRHIIGRIEYGVYS